MCVDLEEGSNVVQAIIGRCVRWHCGPGQPSPHAPQRHCPSLALPHGGGTAFKSASADAHSLPCGPQAAAAACAARWLGSGLLRHRLLPDRYCVPMCAPVATANSACEARCVWRGCRTVLTEQLKRAGVLLEDQLLASLPMVEEVLDHSACSRPLPAAEHQ